jgi:hypothetical protein
MENETGVIELLGNLEIPIESQPKGYAVARIVDFSITTDSVVATATILTDNTMSRIVVDWGDGEVDTLTYKPGELAPAASLFGEDDPLPPGTYRFSHAYDEPEDKQPFEYIVLVRVEDKDGSVDFRVARITLTPRYRVTNYWPAPGSCTTR